ncbi:hypothetical protein DPMN_007928 [Dreissena polymorpha]|uniref:Uncharacterized protein n=2 Tax=Dreissena polymorpha TaxID=45954 RepID=A0A9D4MX34_DREPO|nr:hypothetical protein DPMN_007928 [Dreissena polymorpha]
MRTYWLAGWEGEESTKRFIEEVRIERNEHVRQFSSYENALDLHGMHASTSYTQLAANFSRIRQDSSKTGSHVQLPSLDSKQGEISTKEGLLSRPSSRCSLGNTELSMGEIASGKSLTCSTMEFFSSPPKPTFTITSPECESPKKLSFPALNGSENEMCINNAMISHPQNTSAKADNRIEVTEVKLDIKDVWRTLDSGLCCINEDRKSESLSNMSELNPQNSCYVQSKAFKINERDDDLENANINSVPKSDYSTEISSPVSNTLFVCAKGTVEPTGHINMSQKGRFSLSRFKLKLPDMSHLHKLFNFCHFLKQTNPITGSKPIEAKTVDDLLLDNTNLSESKNERTVDNNSFVAADSRLRASNLNIYSNQSGTDSKDDVAGGELDIVKKDEGHVQNKILKRQPLNCESVSDTNQPLTMEHLRLDDGNKSLDQAGKDWLSSTPSTNGNPAEKESPSLKPNSTNGNLAEKDWPSLKPSTNGNLNKPYNNNHKLQGHIIQGSAQMDFRKEKGHTKSESAREILPEPHICRYPFSAMNTKFHGDLKTNRDSKLFLKTKCIIPYSLKSIVKHEMSQEECIGQNDTIIHNNQSKKACACSCCCHQVPNNSINDTLLQKQINSKECLEIPLTVGQHGSQVVNGQVENAFSEETCQKVVFSLSDEE